MKNGILGTVIREAIEELERGVASTGRLATQVRFWSKRDEGGTKVDIVESSSVVEFRLAEISGPREMVRIIFQNGELEIRGPRGFEAEEKDEKFFRSFRIPSYLAPERATSFWEGNTFVVQVPRKPGGRVKGLEEGMEKTLQSFGRTVREIEDEARNFLGALQKRDP